MGQLDGKTAIVTGAASDGIGRGIARVLAAAGADLGVCDKDQRIVQVAADLAAATGRRVLGWVADVCDASALKIFVDEAANALGGLDIVVANAGVWQRTSALTDSYADSVAIWDRIHSTNLRGVFLTGRAAIPHSAGAGCCCHAGAASHAGNHGARPAACRSPGGVTGGWDRVDVVTTEQRGKFPQPPATFPLGTGGDGRGWRGRGDHRQGAQVALGPQRHRLPVGAAEGAGVERIVYLGGVEPAGEPSNHLRARLETGQLLRAAKVPCLELRASMIVGSGSASWTIVRDLAARLPAMVLPAWLGHRSEPVAVEDVVAALTAAARLPLRESAAWDLPGPEALSGIQILLRIAALMDRRPFIFRVPFVTPRLSSHWIRLVTRADYHLAAELVEGLTSDLLARGAGFWELSGLPAPRTLERAALAALEEDARKLTRSGRLLERFSKLLTPSA